MEYITKLLFCSYYFEWDLGPPNESGEVSEQPTDWTPFGLSF